MATQITASVHHLQKKSPAGGKGERAGPSEPKGGNDTGRRSIDMKSGGQKEES